MALWSAKKDPHEQFGAAVPTDQSGGDDRGNLNQLTERLSQLGQLLNQTNEQVVAYLVHRESQETTGIAGDDATAALAEKIDALGERLDRLADSGPPDNASADQPVAGGVNEEALTAAVRPLWDKLNQQFGALAEDIQALQQRLDAGIQHVADLLQPEEPEETDTLPAVSGDWQRVILGPELADYPGLDFQRQQLLNGVLHGDPAANCFVGQLLVFRSAMTEKMPPLLKEIGEAYYRWQPKTQPGSNPMEEALVAWLQETVQDAGIANTIELVHPGERFDSTRHNASSRGVEITEVHGWVVLRDNGRVYTKASVTVR